MTCLDRLTRTQIRFFAAGFLVLLLATGCGRDPYDNPIANNSQQPDKILFEDQGVDGRTVSQLAQMGHDIAPNSGYFGSVQLILRDAGGELVGAADPRREGARALGY